MVGIDSNVFIYLLEWHPLFFQPASAALTSALSDNGADNGQICVPTLVITEILSGTSNTSIVTFFERDEFHFYDLTKAIATVAGELRFAHSSLKTADSIHLATALAAGANRFITNDYGLCKLDIGLEVVPLKSFAS